jgi:hypothetical protein
VDGACDPDGADGAAAEAGSAAAAAGVVGLGAAETEGGGIASGPAAVWGQPVWSGRAGAEVDGAGADGQGEAENADGGDGGDGDDALGPKPGSAGKAGVLNNPGVAADGKGPATAPRGENGGGMVLGLDVPGLGQGDAPAAGPVERKDGGSGLESVGAVGRPA